MTTMESNTFEKAFSNFIDRREYDNAQNALFDMVRASFKAGWQAAGGSPPEPQPFIELVASRLFVFIVRLNIPVICLEYR